MDTQGRNDGGRGREVTSYVPVRPRTKWTEIFCRQSSDLRGVKKPVGDSRFKHVREFVQYLLESFVNSVHEK